MRDPPGTDESRETTMHAAKFIAPRDPPGEREPVTTGDVEMLAGVGAAITRCLSARPPAVTIERVAVMTGMNVRTLQRRLAEAGYSFRNLRELEYRGYEGIGDIKRVGAAQARAAKKGGQVTASGLMSQGVSGALGALGSAAGSYYTHQQNIRTGTS